MAGRDSLPHFPGRQEYEASQKTPPLPQQRTSSEKQNRSSVDRMYQPGYNQGNVQGGFPQSPVGGYQVGPPPGAGGYAPAPPTQPVYQQAPPVGQPAPPGVDPQMWAAFKAADQNGNGQLSEKELSKALVNADWTPFDGKTVKLMVKMFDADHNGTINYQEFVRLWEYLDQWRGLFRRFDQDNSNAIDRAEFANALTSFGYRLSDKFINILFISYDKRGDGQISFDMFVQSMVTLKTLTEVFKQLDTDRDGFITIGFEQFLEVILRQR